MTVLADNLFKYYNNPPKSGKDKKGAEPKDTEIEVISEEEAQKTPTPPSPPPPAKKRGPLLTGKRIILAVIFLLIAIDIPVGLKLLHQYQDNRTTASTQSESPQLAQIQPSPEPTIPLPPPTDTPVPLPTLPLLPTRTPTATSPIGATEFGTSAPTPTATPSPTETDELAQAAIQTHAECFNGACIEIEGAGTDQCIVDDDCLRPSSSATPTQTPRLASGNPTDIPIPLPDTPAAGSITNTIVGILSGVGILLVALLL